MSDLMNELHCPSEGQMKRLNIQSYYLVSQGVVEIRGHFDGSVVRHFQTNERLVAYDGSTDFSAFITLRAWTQRTEDCRSAVNFSATLDPETWETRHPHVDEGGGICMGQLQTNMRKQVFGTHSLIKSYQSLLKGLCKWDPNDVHYDPTYDGAESNYWMCDSCECNYEEDDCCHQGEDGLLCEDCAVFCERCEWCADVDSSHWAPIGHDVGQLEGHWCRDCASQCEICDTWRDRERITAGRCSEVCATVDEDRRLNEVERLLLERERAER